MVVPYERRADTPSVMCRIINIIVLKSTQLCCMGDLGNLTVSEL